MPLDSSLVGESEHCCQTFKSRSHSVVLLLLKVPSSSNYFLVDLIIVEYSSLSFFFHYVVVNVHYLTIPPALNAYSVTESVINMQIIL
jgi:hypothetical protein